MPNLHIDLAHEPDLYFRVDLFSIPGAARGEFDAAMRRNMRFIETLPGFRGHLVVERREGDEAIDLVTVATWESRAAMERAKEQVAAHYRRIGFDMRAQLEEWGVQMSRVDGDAPGRLQ